MLFGPILRNDCSWQKDFKCPHERLSVPLNYCEPIISLLYLIKKLKTSEGCNLNFNPTLSYFLHSLVSAVCYHAVFSQNYPPTAAQTLNTISVCCVTALFLQCCYDIQLHKRGTICSGKATTWYQVSQIFWDVITEEGRGLWAIQQPTSRGALM